MPKRRIGYVLALLLLVLSACNTDTNGIITSTNTPPSLIVAGIPGLAIVFDSVQGLTAYAEIIVIGTIAPTGAELNMARDPRNTSQPDDRFYTAGGVYQVTVETYLKGTGLPTLLYVQPEASFDSQTTKMPGAQASAKAAYNAIIPKRNNRYLLFLHTLEGSRGDTVFHWWATSSRFDLADPQRVVPEDPAGLLELFPPRTLDHLIAEINQALVTPTPITP
ncbi:MAG: hypothetical protein U0528_02960 [Anaerolineae bacterium]